MGNDLCKKKINRGFHGENRIHFLDLGQLLCRVRFRLKFGPFGPRVPAALVVRQAIGLTREKDSGRGNREVSLYATQSQIERELRDSWGRCQQGESLPLPHRMVLPSTGRMVLSSKGKFQESSKIASRLVGTNFKSISICTTPDRHCLRGEPQKVWWQEHLIG